MANFSHELGYRGKVSLGGVPIMATGGSINVSQSPIMATGVWGAGSYNAAESIIYAPDFLRLEGDVSFELTHGAFIDMLVKFAFTERGINNGKQIQILPNGTGGFNGPVWCQSLNMDASEGSLLSGSFGFASGEVEEGWSPVPVPGTVDGTQTDVGTGGGASAVSGFTGVYPYWGTQVYLGDVGSPPTKQDDIITWSANYSSEVVLLNLCTGRETAPIGPDYIMVGAMSADGSFTLFGLQDLLNVDTFQGSRSCEILSHAYDANSASSPGSAKIKFGKVLFTQGSTSIQQGSSYITADFSFQALGDGSGPPMELSIIE